MSSLATASLLFVLTPAPLLAQSDNVSGTAISFAWPVTGTIVRRYGETDGSGGTLQGIAFAGKAGDTIRAAADGVAIFAGPFRNYGGTLIVNHGCGLHTVVAGPLRPLIEAGQKLRLGDEIGQVARKDGDGAQVYFELRRDGIATDPSLVLPPQGAPAPRTVTCTEIATAKTSGAPAADDRDSQPLQGPGQTEKTSEIKWTGKLPWPVHGEILRPFDPGRNEGIDIIVPEGTKVKAVAKGIVIYAGDGLKELGNTVLIRHEDSLVTVYGNLSQLKVHRGQEVRRGTVIGMSGKSGAAPGPQLHFQVRKKSAPVDPAAYLRKP